jgi:predicted TIM-barrel fold metal-dependent hydrolase
MMMIVPETIIDFHVHLFPDRMFEAIWEFFLKYYAWDVKPHLYYRQCVEFLRERGVGPIVYSNYAHRGGVAPGLNEWNLSVLEEFPDLYCFAAYHPDDDDALVMAERLLDHERILGFKLQLLVQRFFPHDERLFPMYEMIIAKGKRLLLHVGTGPVGNEFVGLEQFRKLMERYPELPVNVAHMGALEYRGFMDLLDEYPNLVFDTAFVFFPGVEGCYNQGGELLEKYRDRIVYGSDFPNLLFPREAEIEGLLDYKLSQEFYEKIFYENGTALIRKHAGKKK